jgi:tRNA(Ile)-lysidine synthase
MKDLAAGLKLMIEKDRLWIALWEAHLPTWDWPQIPAGKTFSLEVPGEFSIRGGWRLCAEKKTGHKVIYQEALENTDPYRAWIDMEKCQPSFIVRSRKPGDRFQPLGMGGNTLKLADFMINEKMPQRSREAWPLVCSGENILWVPGYRMSEFCRLDENSREIVELNLLRIELDKAEGQE